MIYDERGGVAPYEINLPSAEVVYTRPMQIELPQAEVVADIDSIDYYDANGEAMRAKMSENISDWEQQQAAEKLRAAEELKRRRARQQPQARPMKAVSQFRTPGYVIPNDTPAGVVASRTQRMDNRMRYQPVRAIDHGQYIQNLRRQIRIQNGGLPF